MYRIAICDDVEYICHYIERIILDYAKNNLLSIDVEVFYDGQSLQSFIENDHGFDLIYLDIEMQNLNGLDLSKQIRNVQNNYQTEIIFVSGTTKYDRALFDVQPLHFISKPIDPAIIIQDLNLALQKYGNINQSFTFQIGHEIIRLNIKDILYMESLDRQVIVVTSSRKYTYYAAIKEVIKQLPDCFCRIHHSYIINMHHVTAFRKKSVTMANDTILPVSDSYRNDYLRKQQKELFGEVL